MPVTIDDATEAKVREILVESLELEDEELTRTGRFIEDYDADSLGAIEVLSALEKTFGVTIEQDELSNMVNLEAVLEVLSRAEAR
ncbi:acyl carrier protein [Streptomyces oceani]|uniref:Polyketide-8 synthase acyl carrier protein n=1 Tax=Streptomyces oceani TaxID=1075402 RepID=A0A1E7JVR5_9ACTN|nr:acyl carrier protein [Streptomyces oceani]OEU94799.1 polyketide-8 synthase acyl carrier protein [Streptomyces oceani]